MAVRAGEGRSADCRAGGAGRPDEASARHTPVAGLRTRTPAAVKSNSWRRWPMAAVRVSPRSRDEGRVWVTRASWDSRSLASVRVPIRSA